MFYSWTKITAQHMQYAFTKAQKKQKHNIGVGTIIKRFRRLSVRPHQELHEMQWRKFSVYATPIHTQENNQ